MSVTGAIAPIARSHESGGEYEGESERDRGGERGEDRGGESEVGAVGIGEGRVEAGAEGIGEGRAEAGAEGESSWESGGDASSGILTAAVRLLVRQEPLSPRGAMRRIGRQQVLFNQLMQWPMDNAPVTDERAAKRDGHQPAA